MGRVAEFVEIVSEQLGDAALAFLKPEIDRLREKEQARKIQRRGTRKPTGKPRGRPRLTPEKAAESKERRRAYMRELMRRKRAER